MFGGVWAGAGPSGNGFVHFTSQLRWLVSWFRGWQVFVFVLFFCFFFFFNKNASSLLEPGLQQQETTGSSPSVLDDKLAGHGTA